MTSPSPPGSPSSAPRERWAVRPRITLTADPEILAIAWGQVGDRPVLASGSGRPGDYGTVRLWDPEQGRELHSLQAHSGGVLAVAWGQLGDRTVLATGGGEGTVRLWDPEQGQQLHSFQAHSGGVFAVAWGQLGDRTVLATGDAEGTVRLWDPEQGRELRTLAGHEGEVRAIVWGQLGDRTVLASGGAEGSVRLWDPEQGRELRTLAGHRGGVFEIAWGQMGDRVVLASVGRGGPVRLWDLEQDQELDAGGIGGIFTLAWGQLGDRPVLACGSSDSPGTVTVRLWDPEQGRELHRVPTHSGVFAVAWGQLDDRPVLASGSVDGTVQLWDLVIERFEDRIPGYRADDPSGPDRLRRDAEAAALAEMITAQSARPPLAIGLFGDWGEGKTHFLRLIADHVDAFAATAYAPGEDRLTYSAVRQVWFNAWHYAETDLWASLVAELFSQMTAGAGDAGKEERSQARLAAELAARRQLPERLHAARARQQALTQELDKLIGRQWTLPLRLSPELQAQLAGLAGDKPDKLYQSVREAADGISGAARLAGKVGAIFVRRPWFWLALALLAAAVIIWLKLGPGPLRAILSAITAAAGVFGAGAAAVWGALRQLRDKTQAAIRQVEQYADTRRRRLQTALDATRVQVEALQAELQDLTPAGQLTALVERRGRTDSPYRAQLGLMTQIREDFEQMARLLTADRPPGDPDVDAVGDELPRIDRIVVYIDDLDRCPPDRVVQVLEAVQLMLAVPLFVVIVAVDPRWLLRSLTVHYSELFGSPDTNAASQDDSWDSTPMQYLEKIFQIPFTLPPVDQAGYTAMIDALTGTASSADQPAASPQAGHPDSLPPAAATSVAAGAVVGRPRQLPAVPVVERFDPLALTEDERRLLAFLGPPLVTTPRSIKRLVNSYGLLNAMRGSQHEKDLQALPPDGAGNSYYPYRAAIVLLGILIAFPGLSPLFFPQLVRASSEPGSCSWPEFLKRIYPQRTADSWTSELLGTRLTEAEALRWEKLARTLERLTTEADTVGLPLPEPLDAWAKWAIPVGRLSFETGRSVITL